MADAPRPEESPVSPGGPCGCRTERVRGPTQGGCDIPDRILYCPLHRDAKATARRLAEVEAERDALRDAAIIALDWFDRGGMSDGEIERSALRDALARAGVGAAVGVDPEVEDDEAYDALQPDRGERPDEGGEGD